PCGRGAARGIQPPWCAWNGQHRSGQCRLYDDACTPDSPIGPCMVSDEGACHIWWRAGSGRQLKQKVGA
ncbi:MAG: hydrogenase formation protein HypD, partial [Gammaproteobacteria bacterium]